MASTPHAAKKEYVEPNVQPDHLEIAGDRQWRDWRLRRRRPNLCKQLTPTFPNVNPEIITKAQALVDEDDQEAAAHRKPFRPRQLEDLDDPEYTVEQLQFRPLEFTQAKLDSIWASTRPRKQQAQDELDRLPTMFFEELCTSLFARVWDFAGEAVGQQLGDDPSQEAVGVRVDDDDWTSRFLTHLPEEFVRIASVTARADPNFKSDSDPSGYEYMFVDRESRINVCTSVIAKLLQEHCFDSLLFGARKIEREALRKIDESQEDTDDGFARKMSRAASVPKYLLQDLFTVNFWPEVDRVTLGILKLLLPVINFAGELEPDAPWLELTELHQSLHNVVAEAAWLGNGLALTRSCFWIDFPQPGQLWDVRQEHITDIIWKRSSEAATAMDRPDEIHKQVVWARQAEDAYIARPRKQTQPEYLTSWAQANPGNLPRFNGPNGPRAWKKARLDAWREYDNTPEPSREQFLADWERTNPRPRKTVRRMAKVQVALWPFFERSFPYKQDLVSGDINSGESTSVLQKAQVVYYAGVDDDKVEQEDEDYTLGQYLEDERARNKLFNRPVRLFILYILFPLLLLYVGFMIGGGKPWSIRDMYGSWRDAGLSFDRNSLLPNWDVPRMTWPHVTWPDSWRPDMNMLSGSAGGEGLSRGATRGHKGHTGHGRLVFGRFPKTVPNPATESILPMSQSEAGGVTSAIIITTIEDASSIQTPDPETSSTTSASKGDGTSILISDPSETMSGYWDTWMKSVTGRDLMDADVDDDTSGISVEIRPTEAEDAATEESAPAETVSSEAEVEVADEPAAPKIDDKYKQRMAAADAIADATAEEEQTVQATLEKEAEAKKILEDLENAAHMASSSQEAVKTSAAQAAEAEEALKIQIADAKRQKDEAVKQRLDAEKSLSSAASSKSAAAAQQSMPTPDLLPGEVFLGDKLLKQLRRVRDSIHEHGKRLQEEVEKDASSPVLSDVARRLHVLYERIHIIVDAVQRDPSKRVKAHTLERLNMLKEATSVYLKRQHGGLHNDPEDLLETLEQVDEIYPADDSETIHARGSVNWKKLFGGVFDGMFGDGTTSTTATITTTVVETPAIPTLKETVTDEKLAHHSGVMDSIFEHTTATTTTTTTTTATTVVEPPASLTPEEIAMVEKLAHQPGVIVTNANGDFEYILKSEFEADKGKKYKGIVSEKFADFLAKLKSDKAARGSTASEPNKLVVPDPAQQPLEHPFKVSIAPDTIFTDPARPGEKLDMAKGFWIQENILGHDYSCFIRTMEGACVTSTWMTKRQTVTVVDTKTVGGDDRTTATPAPTA